MHLDMILVLACCAVWFLCVNVHEKARDEAVIP